MVRCEQSKEAKHLEREQKAEAQRREQLSSLEAQVSGYVPKSSYQMMQQRRARSELGMYPSQEELNSILNTKFSPPRRGVRSPQPQSETTKVTSGQVVGGLEDGRGLPDQFAFTQGTGYDPEYLRRIKSNDPGHARRRAQLDNVHAVKTRKEFKSDGLSTSGEMLHLANRSRQIDARLRGRTRLVS